MFVKALFAILVTVGVGVTLLSQRQQQLQTMHEMTRTHQRIDEARKSIWDQQVEISQTVRPQHLRAALESRELNVEPAVPYEPPVEPFAGPLAGTPAHEPGP